jgi:GT2 family glycosyltransferase
MNSMDVSVIIVSWNTKDILRKCLTSIYEQGGDTSFEVIVIDNASADGSAEMVRMNFPQVNLIENSENRGFAAANNQGIKIAKGRYILLLNSDTIVLDNAIGKALSFADANTDVGVLGCQVLENSQTAQTVQMTCFRFPDILNLLFSVLGLNRIFKYNRLFGREWMLWWPRDSQREVDVVTGSFMLVRRKAIDEIGLMDEDYFLYYEETDWCYRFTKAGWKVLFWPGAQIIHWHGGGNSSKQNALKMFVQFQKSLLLFFKKNYGWLHFFAARLLLIFSFGLRCCSWLLMALFNRILGNGIDREKEKIIKHWVAFKYCAFGVAPKSV